MNKNNLHGLYAITDPALMQDKLIEKTQLAIKGGINILQYRNKTAPLEQQESEAKMLANMCHENNVLFIINDNVELALKVNADGVHLGQKDTDTTQARKQLGENKIIGVTCHNKIDFAVTAQQQGADYVAFGRFYTSLTKPDAPQAELALLNEARKIISIPLVAIGGITHDTALPLLQNGADMLAVVQGVFAQEDILAATRQFVKIIDSPDASV